MMTQYLELLHGGPGVQAEGDGLREDAVLGRQPSLGLGTHLHQLGASEALLLTGHLQSIVSNECPTYSTPNTLT